MILTPVMPLKHTIGNGCWQWQKLAGLVKQVTVCVYMYKHILDIPGKLKLHRRHVHVESGPQSDILVEPDLNLTLDFI